MVLLKDDALARDRKERRFKPMGEGVFIWLEVYASGEEAEWFIYEHPGSRLCEPFDRHLALIEAPPFIVFHYNSKYATRVVEYLAQ